MSETAITAPSDEEPKKDEQVVAHTPNFANLPLDLQKLTLNQLNFIGKSMAASGMFNDIQDANAAIVKILAGQEIGVTPFQAMTNIHIIQGKATMGANLMAAKLKGSGKYDYRVTELSNTSCTIAIYQRDIFAGKTEKIGEYSFSMSDAQRMGLAAKDNWRKYPQAMLFARAISQAVRLFAPDVFNGNLVYTPDELGAEEDDEGNVTVGSDITTNAPPKQDSTPEPTVTEPSSEQTPSDIKPKRGRPKKQVGSSDDLPSKAQVNEVKSKFERLGYQTESEQEAYSELTIGKKTPETSFDYNDLSAALSDDIAELEREEATS